MNSSSASNPPKRLRVFSCANQGARDYQEDRHGQWSGDPGRSDELFIVVLDGAGGHGGGAEAAEAALRAAESSWKSKNHGNPEDFLKTWMETAHDEVNQAGKAIRRSARAVAVACLTDGHSAHWVHAGDSRLIHFRDGKLLSRTRDDSVVQVLFERGDITEEEMGTHPDQGRLLQSLGGEEPPKPRLGSAELEPGDSLLLCTDGFWEHLSTGELEALSQTPPRRMQAALDAAVAKAVQRAEPKADNTTATIIIRDGRGGASGVPSWIMIVVAAFLGIVGALAFHFYRNNQGEAVAPAENVRPMPGPTRDTEPGLPLPGTNSMNANPLLPDVEPPPTSQVADPLSDESELVESGDTENPEPTETPEP